MAPVQREAAQHQAAEAELAAAVEAAAAEADALRRRVSELEAAQAAPDRQSVAAVQQQAVAAERWAAAAQVCPDMYSLGLHHLQSKGRPAVSCVGGTLQARGRELCLCIGHKLTAYHALLHQRGGRGTARA